MSPILLPHSTTAPAAAHLPRLQLACRAISPAAVRAAVDAGADWVRIPYRFMHNDRNERLTGVIQYAHRRARKLVLDLDTQTDATWQNHCNSILRAVGQGFDAVALSDVSLALYSSTRHPSMPLHITVSADICARTVRLLKLQMNAARILVPHDISTAQLAAISAGIDAELEIFTSGGQSADPSSRRAGGASNDSCYFPEQRAWNALLRLPLLASLGVRAIQVGPCSDMPDKVADVVHIWRTAIERCHEDGEHYAVEPSWRSSLGMA